MLLFAIAYAATGLAFLLLDGTYLTVMGDLFYRPHLGHLLQEGFDLAPAIAFYLIHVAGLVLFAVRPGLIARRARVAALYGAAFGLVTYATYDLTNQATLKDWPLMVSLVDMAWGTLLGAAAAAAGCAITLKARRFV
ncbi:DUF2177 family protein [Aquabacter cavernae]|uniref:DUF2177 family protein n=1 Tax=Aquabacter cavernae TaxID=2496029 RepID=UPI000F8F301B|nr:DUF2177 family protein [Aquabacter cavernae]